MSCTYLYACKYFYYMATRLFTSCTKRLGTFGQRVAATCRKGNIADEQRGQHVGRCGWWRRSNTWWGGSGRTSHRRGVDARHLGGCWGRRDEQAGAVGGLAALVPRVPHHDAVGGYVGVRRTPGETVRVRCHRWYSSYKPGNDSQPGAVLQHVNYDTCY